MWCEIANRLLSASLAAEPSELQLAVPEFLASLAIRTSRDRLFYRDEVVGSERKKNTGIPKESNHVGERRIYTGCDSAHGDLS